MREGGRHQQFTNHASAILFRLENMKTIQASGYSKRCFYKTAPTTAQRIAAGTDAINKDSQIRSLFAPWRNDARQLAR